MAERPAGAWDRILASLSEANRRRVHSAARAAPTVAFLAGFAWDSATLRRVDQVFDNVLLLAYLVVLGALLVVERRVALGRLGWEPLARRVEWVRFGTQFFFGGLLSAYVVFYFKSASSLPTLLFVGVLAAGMVVNEYLEDRLQSEPVRLGLFYLCAFSFLLFFVPVMTGWPGPGLFLVAGVVAALLGGVVALAIHGPDLPRLRTLGGTFGGLFCALLALDAARVIPPVPLAIAEIGIFHEVRRTGEGYELRWERPPWWRPFADDDTLFRQREGDRAWCFTAVFAPRGMDTRIWHRWERYDEEAGEWVETDRLPFPIRGGRDGGYRGYTAKRRLTSGEWRVRVEMEGGREVGRIRFEVVEGEGEPEWRERLAG